MKLSALFFILILCSAWFNLKSQNVVAGRSHTLAICENGSVLSWGLNSNGQLGEGSKVDKALPAQVFGLNDIVEISGGSLHSIFLSQTGNVWACGSNSNGCLGDNTDSMRTEPIQVYGLTGIVSVAAGNGYSIFLKGDGTVWACGSNIFGQLGNGFPFQSNVPLQIAGLTGITAFYAGENFSLFLKSDGTVLSCGNNDFGQLGDSTNTNRLAPVQVKGITGIVAISGGNGHSLFLKNDGTVWACGNNSDGQLGDGTNLDRSYAAQVNGLNGIIKIDGGDYHSLFLKNDGKVWVCGQNYDGQLGDGTLINKKTPVQLNGFEGVKSITGGAYHSLFLKIDGTVWATGYNFFGQLGDGTLGNRRFIPVQTNGLCVIKDTKGISGFVFKDFNQNCVKEFELGLPARKLLINPGNIIVESSLYGEWHLDSLPVGTYTITVDTSGKWDPTCPVTQSFTISNASSHTRSPDFGFVSTQPCPSPDIFVDMPLMRPGFSNQKIYVKVSNDILATGAVNNAYVDLSLDSLLIPQSSTISYSTLGNNIYRFNLDTINPGEWVSFIVTCSLSVNAPLGKTLCINALLFPADSCVFDTIPDVTTGVGPCTLPWDKSSLKVEGACLNNDSIRFVVYNTGDPVDGDMECYSPVRLFIDGQIQLLDSIMLDGGDSMVYVYPGDGRTWRLEADQHPLHPGNSHPNETIEACGNNAAWTPGLVNVLPMDDADPVIDIMCGVVTGSYDPNDKTGYPIGVGTDHDILPNQQLQYVIRFQNTGTDTAFTIVVRDTLDTDLDIFSVRSGTSSHPYIFKMYGPRVMEWTFNNILLPDSNRDEPGSHGFLSYSVNQVPNLTNGTMINNRAGIYFDFNAPIITNTATHKIDDGIRSFATIKEFTQEAIIKAYPNPFNNSTTILVPTNDSKLEFDLFDILGKKQFADYNMSIANNNVSIILEKGDLKPGVYYFKIRSSNNVIGTGKVMMVD